MALNIDKEPKFVEKFKYFFQENKIKFFILIIIVLISTILLIFFKENKKKENILVSEKYTKAGILLQKNQNEDALKHYEEIILSKNNFYSILSLNTIIENKLVKDKKKILNYFEILEKVNKSNEYYDLIIFKKSLYLLKNSDQKGGLELLEILINSDSKYKDLAKNIVEK